MIRVSKPLTIIIGLLAGVLAGCSGHTAIPSGGQQVHITITGSAIRLDPATARAGDIYIVVDTPGAAVLLVQRKTTAEEKPGPMSNDDLARLAHGDTQGMAISCCFETGEPHGNIHKVVLSAGMHVFTIGSPEEGAVPPEMALLEVLP